MLGRILKDGNNIYCIIAGKTYPVRLDVVDKISNGDLVQIQDIKKADKRKVYNRSNLLVIKRISKDVNFPQFKKSTPLQKKLENRIVDLRTPENYIRFIIRGKLNVILLRLFDERNYLNVNTPTIVGSITEGRVKTFEIDFFGKKASLNMTKLVYLRYLICSDFEKVYELSPVFVGGKHNTPNHLSEYYTFDWASSEKISFDKYLQYVDSILLLLVSDLSKLAKLLKFGIQIRDSLVRDIKRAKVITYSQLMEKYCMKYQNDKEVLEQFHIPDRVISFGHSCYGEYFWVKDFPEHFKQFYCDTVQKENKKVVLASELWWKNTKIASVSFSNSDYEKTLKRIVFLGLDPKNFKTYLNAINIASNEAYLGSIYIERLMMVLLSIDNMKNTLMFPRSEHGTILDP